MNVKFKFPFFSSGHSTTSKDGRASSGNYYGPGIHRDVPDGIPLPSSAVVLKDSELPDEVEAPKEETLSAYDMSRKSAEALYSKLARNQDMRDEDS